MPGVLCVHPLLAPSRPAPRPPALAVTLPAGRHRVKIRLAEPPGVIAEYRVSAPPGDVVRVAVMIPRVTVPLALWFPRRAWWEHCWNSGASTVCGASEEACPIPVAAWRLTLDKLSGPPGRVRVWFRVADGGAS